jgi:multicomponent Na+:H+ antiporter subunit D
MLAALVMMWRYRDTDAPLFQVLMLVFLAGMVGFSLSGDLFNMFVFFELMSVAAVALAGYKVEDESVEGSLNFGVTNIIGSFLILIGLGLTYARTGALNLAQIGDALGAGGPPDGLVVVAFSLLACGFLIKAAAVPFHFWLADAYAVAPTPVCLLFAGAMSELGIYAVGRIWFAAFEPALGEGAPELRVVLIIAGCLTALVGAVMCLAQDHLKRMLAFATISYVGVFIIGLGLLSPVGVAGAALFVAADGFGKAALFGAVGVLQHAGRQVSEVGLRGVGRTLPLAGLAFALGAASFAAIPPFGTFFAKAMLEGGLVEEGHAWAIPVLIVASALTAAAVLRAGGRIFLGWGRGGASRSEREEAEEEGPPEHPPLAMLVPTLLLGFAALALGLIPGAVEHVHEAAMRFADGGAYAQVVLGGGDVPRLEAAPVTASTSAYAYAALTLTAAVALAALALFDRAVPGGAGPRIKGAAARVVAPLRALHSGHIGDYVSFLVFGSALLGGALAISLG